MASLGVLVATATCHSSYDAIQYDLSSCRGRPPIVPEDLVLTLTPSGVLRC